MGKGLKKVRAAAWAGLIALSSAHAAQSSPSLEQSQTPNAHWFRSTYMDVKDSLPKLRVERAWVHHVDQEWAYAHHPYLVRFEPTGSVGAPSSPLWVAMWSSSQRDEDAVGQRVAFATSSDLRTWTQAQVLASPGVGKDGKRGVLTPAGFVQHTHAGGTTLTAFYSCYEHDMIGTRMFAQQSLDGITWGPPIDIGVPSCPNGGPTPIAGGRLILPGNTTFPYTDDPSGLCGWTQASLFPAWHSQHPEDNPRTFWEVQKVAGWPVGLCSSGFFETREGTIRMLLRARGEQGWRLWLSDSTDRGATYSPPLPTEFLDNDASFQFGVLPEGIVPGERVWYVGFPDPARGWARSKLILSLSDDDKVFDKHFVIADEPYDIQFHGQYKLGDYSYPHASVLGNSMYILVSREKEAMEVIWFDLGKDLGKVGRSDEVTK
jgi:hypothetical protein